METKLGWDARGHNLILAKDKRKGLAQGRQGANRNFEQVLCVL